eukprot:1142608-Pelagomonas_calceolata.AAC.1
MARSEPAYHKNLATMQGSCCTLSKRALQVWVSLHLSIKSQIAIVTGMLGPSRCARLTLG